MTLIEIATQLAQACRDGREAEALDTLYAVDAVSVEAADMGNGREAHGLEAIRGKHAWWNSAMEAVDTRVGGPFPHGDDRFALHFRLTGRNRADGKSWDMEEIGVFHVADGKIVREEFFYDTTAPE